MKVIDHLKRAESSLISFEITPPKRGAKIQNILQIVEDFADKKYTPSFIHVTSRAADIKVKETPEGIRVKKTRKRPGTLGVSILSIKRINCLFKRIIYFEYLIHLINLYYSRKRIICMLGSMDKSHVLFYSV